MAKKKRAKKTAGKRAKRTARRKPTGARARRMQAESARFVEGLLVRGEAARPDARGKLPPEATHVIEGETAAGTARVRRVRFKLL